MSIEFDSNSIKAKRTRHKYNERNRNLKKNYGITNEQYERMRHNQFGFCAICSDQDDGEQLVIDHDHDTGKR